MARAEGPPLFVTIGNLLHAQMSVVVLGRLSLGSEQLALKPAYPSDLIMK